MGARNINRIPPEGWRQGCESVGCMARMRWFVRATCRTCGLEVEVKLARVIREKGEAFSLWDKTRPCVRLLCPGQMDFFAQPPDVRAPFRLFTAGR